jgi:hypothetical protein
MRRSPSFDPSMPTDEELLAEARRRAQELGPKPYPVLTCPRCFAITGWLGSDGACLSCWTRRGEHTWNTVPPLVHPAIAEATVPLVHRIRRSLGMGTTRDRLREWLRLVEPGDTGPVAPEEGWELEGAVKYDLPTPDRAHRIVRFDDRSYRFEYGRRAQPRRLARGARAENGGGGDSRRGTRRRRSPLITGRHGSRR